MRAMAIQNKMSGLVCAGLAACNVLVAVAAQGQDVSFEAARNYEVGSGPFPVAVGDFNGDGIKDLAVANVSSNNVSVLWGNGDGSFQAPRNFAAGSVPVSVAVGDFNGDGHLDLAVSNNTAAGTVAVLLGNGDGSFQAPRIFAAGTYPYS